MEEEGGGGAGLWHSWCTITGRQNRPAQAVSMWGEEGEEQGGGRGRAWQHNLPFKVEESVSFEPHLEVDTEVEPKTVAVQETGHT